MAKFPRAIAGPALVGVWIGLGAGIGAQPPEDPELVSPLGLSYYADGEADEIVSRADEARAADPGSIDRLVEAVRARVGTRRFREALAILDEALAAGRRDIRLVTLRGQVRTALRRFEDAIDDLEAARNRALDSLEVSWSLGLAYHFRGDFGIAADELARCFHRTAASGRLPRGWRRCTDLDAPERLRIADWLYRSLVRASRFPEARAVLEPLDDSLEVPSGDPHLRTVLFFKGARAADQVVDSSLAAGPFVSVASGVAIRQFVEGDFESACAMFDRVIATRAWTEPGFIAAEAELARSGSPCQFLRGQV